MGSLIRCLLSSTFSHFSFPDTGKQKASMCQISNFLRYPCYHKLGCPSLATLVVQRCCTSTRSARGAEYKWRRWRAMTSGSNFILFFKRKKNNSYFKWSHVNDSAWTPKSYMGSFFFFFHICDLCILISVLSAWLHPGIAAVGYSLSSMNYICQRKKW